MSKRNYTHIQELLPTIQAMVAEGMTQREIAEHFGFKDKSVVKFALMRARKKGTTIPKFRGRKPAKTLQEYKYENKRLKMENELLRDFLSLTERMWGRNLSIRLLKHNAGLMTTSTFTIMSASKQKQEWHH